MLEYKQSTNIRLPVRLLDSSGTPVTGVVFGGVSATAEKSDGTTVDITPASGSFWVEQTAGAFASQGVYDIIAASSTTGLTGIFKYAVSVGGAKTFVNYVKIVANEEADTYARLGAPVGASVSADIARVLGLLHENSVMDMTSFDASNNLISARIRTYDSKAHAQSAGVTGLIASYAISSTFVGPNLQTYTVTRES